MSERSVATAARPGAARRTAEAGEAGEALLASAADTMAKGSKSFAAAARFFDAETRASATMLYAWCRHCDDSIDEQILGFDARRGGRAAPSPAARLAALREGTLAAFAGVPPPDPAFVAVATVAARHDLPLSYALEHLRGYEMDVDGARFETLSDTLLYCWRVAGVVGAMMGIVMGAREPRTLDRASDLGIAFQLTNIARDLLDDARGARVYLPADWLAAEGMESPREILDPRRREGLARLAARLLTEAEPYYASARDGLPDLPFRSALAVATALEVYRAIGLRVLAEGPAAWDRRAGTTRPEKTALALKGMRLALASRRRCTVAPRPADLFARPL